MLKLENKIISINIRSPLGFFKKYDINEDIYLTYNYIHKPALLGIFGSILGLGGYYQAFSDHKDKLPDYFEKLSNIKIGIKPITTSNGIFTKTIIVYNNSVGYANKDGNLIVKEQTLINPKYKVYILIDQNDPLQVSLADNLKKQETTFIPYMGKNDYQLDWDCFCEYDYLSGDVNDKFTIDTIFLKEYSIKDTKVKHTPLIEPIRSNVDKYFVNFERLPIGFNDITKNYQLEEFVYTNMVLSPEYKYTNLYEIVDSNGLTKFIQLI